MRTPDAPSYLDLFSRPAGRDLVPYERRAPEQTQAATTPTPAETANVDPAALPPPSGQSRPNPRHISPRAMQELSLELYANGHLTFEDHAELTFQPELHPAYPKTVGALTGEPASPDKPRDFVKHWEERLAFERRHNPADAPTVKQAERIVGVLSAAAEPPTDVKA